ncbi:MAG TPA: hypothetical protein VKT29_16295 [Terriglobales bacterium]|nr:hypothetical protein [Terriglobales bacterium]
MSELEHRLNQVLEEHQHESGLHMIGGRHKLLDRLVRFCEQEFKQEWRSQPRSDDEDTMGRTA